MGLDLAERRLMGQSAGERRFRPGGFRLYEVDVAAVFHLLACELVEQSLRTIALDGEQAGEDLVAQRWRPCGPPREPRAGRPPPPRRPGEEAPKPRTHPPIPPRP